MFPYIRRLDYFFHSAGCLQAAFDNTFPIHLNGIIRQDEFQESIRRINNAFATFRTFVITMWVVFSITITGGTFSFVIGGLMATTSMTTFYVLLGLGTVLTTFGTLLVGIGFCLIHARRETQLRTAVSEESKKYSLRSVTPCSWRLDTSRNWLGFNGCNQNNQLFYQVNIVFKLKLI